MGCAHPVWLPSARAGICWALRAAVGPGDRVLGPAFTCGVVHEAIVRTGATMDLIDAAEDDFLVNEEAMARSQNGRHALVVCELYGHMQGLESAGRTGSSFPSIRIVDMAMTVPQPALLQRLRPDDFAIVSFGIGKSMYAGWGAMGFAGNEGLAHDVKKLRDSTLAGGGFGLRLRRTAEISLRTLGHYSAIYSLAKKLRPPMLSKNSSDAHVEGIPDAWSDAKSMAAEWKMPSTHPDCALAMWNLKHAGLLHEARLELALRYHENLTGTEGLICPKISRSALSHYTVRVAPEIRTRVRKLLFESGINTITLWDFPRYLDRDRFPNASRRSLEVLNLPIIPTMPASRIDQICENLKKCLALARRESPGND